MKKTGRILALVTTAVMILTLFVPAGVLAASAKDTLPPVTDSVHYQVGAADSNATELPHLAADWPEQAPELETQYVWAQSDFVLYVTTDFDYHHRVVYVSERWVDHQPSTEDEGVYAVTDWYQYGRTIRMNGPLYVYFLYYDQPGVYTSACYAALIEPAAATVTSVQIASPSTMPEDGFPRDETVSLQPVWSVGVVHGDVFTEIPGLEGFPRGAGVQWALSGSETGSVVDAAENITPGADAAVLVPPEEGGALTYTASVVSATGDPANRWNLYEQPSPVSVDVLWSSAPVPDAPGPDNPEPDNPEPDHPEGWLPPITHDMYYTVGGAEANVTPITNQADAWPQEEPDLALQYAWADSQMSVHVTTEFDYHHRVLLISDHWLQSRPDPNEDDEVTDITHWNDLDRNVPLDGVLYLYFFYYDEPGVYPSDCFAAKIQPVAATVSSIELVTPDARPDEGFALGDAVSLRPVWSVGTVSDGVFTVLPELSGYPDNAGVKWAEADSMGSGVVDAADDVTPGDSPAALISPLAGGLYTYTATVTNIEPHGVYGARLHVADPPASIEILWAEDAPSGPIIGSAPGASFTVTLAPNPDGSGSILTGVPMGGPSTETTTAGEFLRQITIPPETTAAVCSPDGSLLAASDRLGTGCTVQIADAEGTTIFTATIVIRGDVLGSGVLNIAQLVRLAAACNGSRPLTGLYAEAGRLLTGSDAVNISSLVALARMLQER